MLASLFVVTHPHQPIIDDLKIIRPTPREFDILLTRGHKKGAHDCAPLAGVFSES